ncbi:SH3 domain-containing protein [Flectobacillus rivi]|uniref:SH3 domain-containing protein n=1 Tax=Flectobacillus rivi TaxID=2984209 RepID=A0ABT6YWD2_9BACT|nr:SH3 domain-containing protein [Flectobacillus rivi]MDI9873195.1 SH3 domain-containing protein [Flectobacillus rivi]
MKSILRILLVVIVVFHCKGQSNVNPLIGTWEIISREYIYQKNELRYSFTKEEKLAYLGQKVVFTKDSVLSFTTTISEGLVSPIKYRKREIYVDNLDFEGNLVSILKKRGNKVQEFTITEINNKQLKPSEEYTFYYFNDGTCGFLMDFSFFFLKKISSLNIGYWEKNEFGESIIKGNYSENIAIPVDKRKKIIHISYIPNLTGENLFSIEADKGTYADKWIKVLKIKDKNNHNFIQKFIYLDDSIKNIRLFVGGSEAPLKDGWIIKYRYLDNVFKVKSTKVFINTSVNVSSSIYLIKGDEVEILEEKGEWLKIRYYGKKTIEGWIKKRDVE